MNYQKKLKLTRELFTKEMKVLIALLDNIRALDKKDKKNDGHHYKHLLH